MGKYGPNLISPKTHPTAIWDEISEEWHIPLEYKKNSRLKKSILLTAPYTLDDSVRLRIEKWSYPAKAMEIWDVLNLYINGPLESGLEVHLIQCLYNDALEFEGITHADIEKAVALKTY